MNTAFDYVDAAVKSPTTVPDGNRDLCGYALAVCFRNFLTIEEASAIVERVYANRESWSPGFDGEQFAIGEVWYHFRETGQPIDTYLQIAEASRTLVETVAPGLHNRIVSHLRRVVTPDDVRLRPGWAGPGIMVFPVGERVADVGGTAHVDWDGLSADEAADPNLRAYSFVCMLQKPASGGGLSVWPRMEVGGDGRDLDDVDVSGCEPLTIDYQVGDLWMFRSMCAHAIDSFQGPIDRICLTFHAARREHRWDVWF